MLSPGGDLTQWLNPNFDNSQSQMHLSACAGQHKGRLCEFICGQENTP